MSPLLCTGDMGSFPCVLLPLPLLANYDKGAVDMGEPLLLPCAQSCLCGNHHAIAVGLVHSY